MTCQGSYGERTSSFLARKGYKVLRIDFSNSSYSETFNPLLECKSISDIQKLALIIIQNSIGESKSDPFWENSSVMLLSLFARYLVFIWNHNSGHCKTFSVLLKNLQ